MRIAPIVLVALLIAGCGNPKSEKLPAACTAGPEAISKALDNAPGAVTINGTSISDCFNRNASSDDIQILGTMLVSAAQQLDDSAGRGAPGAALKLGYLVGAAERGNKRNNGLGSEIVHRMQGETLGIRGRQAEYERGIAAGLARG